jgi:hypothetical protein
MKQLFVPEDETIIRIHDLLFKLTDHRPGRSLAGSSEQLTPARLAELVETAFWASLRSNEGRATRVRMTIVNPEDIQDATVFTTRVAYDESQVAKLAPAVPEGGCLLVSSCDRGWEIWGFGRSWLVPSVSAVTLEISEPGAVRLGLGRYQPLAVLNGRSNSFLAANSYDLAFVMKSVLRKVLPYNDPFETQAVWSECVALKALARMIIVSGHGGLVLIVPGETGSWENSLNPFAYRFKTPNSTVRDGIRQQLKKQFAEGGVHPATLQHEPTDKLKCTATGELIQHAWYSEQDVRAIASLAGVDGAIVMTRSLQVLGFGAKLSGDSTADKVTVFRAASGGQREVLEVRELGGTRHQSAAQFVARNPDTASIVISHDRHLSIMHWNDEIKQVEVIREVEWFV